MQPLLTKVFFSGGYKDSYSLEEVNQKLLGFQQKAVKEIEKKSPLMAHLESGFTRAGAVNIEMNASSPSMSGEGTIKIEDYKVETLKENLDLTTGNVEISGNINAGQGVNNSFSLATDSIKIINNSDGFYIKTGDITHDTASLNAISRIPSDLIQALNELAESGRFLAIEDNQIINTYFREMVSSQANSAELQAFLTDVLKKENLLEAYKQEGSKYHLAPSRFLCSVRKSLDDQNLSDSPEVFMSALGEIKELYPDLQTCNTQEYQDFINTALGDDEQKRVLYIELGEVWAMLHAEIEETEKYKMSYDSTFSLKGIQSARLEIIPMEDSISGRGILLEMQNELLAGYIDINSQAEKFAINIDITPAENDRNMNAISGKIEMTSDSSEDLSPLSSGGSETVSGDINGQIGKNDNGGFMGQIGFDIETRDSRAQAPTNANGELFFDYTRTGNETLGKIELKVDAGEQGNMEYKINFNEMFENSVSSQFETPREIQPYSEFGSFMIPVVPVNVNTGTPQNIQDFEEMMKVYESLNQDIDMSEFSFPQ